MQAAQAYFSYYVVYAACPQIMHREAKKMFVALGKGIYVRADRVEMIVLLPPLGKPTKGDNKSVVRTCSGSGNSIGSIYSPETILKRVQEALSLAQ